MTNPERHKSFAIRGSESQSIKTDCHGAGGQCRIQPIHGCRLCSPVQSSIPWRDTMRFCMWYPAQWTSGRVTNAGGLVPVIYYGYPLMKRSSMKSMKGGW